MAWQTPKTDWGAADVPLPDDFNRIEGNVQDLQNTKETPAGAQAKANTAETNAKNYAGNLVGSLSSLATTAKNNVVAAINEVYNWLNSVASTLTNHMSTNASTSQRGHVQLSTSTDSTSTTMAATPSAVKAAYDRGLEVVRGSAYVSASVYDSDSETKLIAIGKPGKQTGKIIYRNSFSNGVILISTSSDHQRWIGSYEGLDRVIQFGSGTGNVPIGHWNIGWGNYMRLDVKIVGSNIQLTFYNNRNPDPPYPNPESINVNVDWEVW